MGSFVNTITQVELDQYGTNNRPFHRIHFTKQNGQPGKAAVFPNTPAYGVVPSLQPGQVVTVETGQNNSVQSITLGGNMTQNNWTGSKKSYTSNTDNAAGAQVGNALNVAATILGAGKTVQELMQTAREVLTAGNQLKEELAAGAFNAQHQPAQQVQQQAAFTAPPPASPNVQQPTVYQMPQQGQPNNGMPI